MNCSMKTFQSITYKQRYFLGKCFEKGMRIKTAAMFVSIAWVESKSKAQPYPTLGVVPTAFNRRWSEGSLEIRNGCGRSIDGWEIVRLDYGSGVLSLSFLCLVPHSRGILSPSYRVMHAPSLRSCT